MNDKWKSGPPLWAEKPVYVSIIPVTRGARPPHRPPTAPGTPARDTTMTSSPRATVLPVARQSILRWRIAAAEPQTKGHGVAAHVRPLRYLQPMQMPTRMLRGPCLSSSLLLQWVIIILNRRRRKRRMRYWRYVYLVSMIGRGQPRVNVLTAMKLKFFHWNSCTKMRLHSLNFNDYEIPENSSTYNSITLRKYVDNWTQNNIPTGLNH